MGAFFINSISVSRFTSLSMHSSLLKNNQQQQKKNITVCYCQGSTSCSSNGGTGNVKAASSNNGLPASSSSIVTDNQRSSILPMPKPDYGTAAALIDSESFMRTPNGKITSQAVSYNSPSAADISSFHDHEGIGIVSFLRGKRFLITGATGFLAKVLIEKILRTAPDVGKIFLLIKAADKEAAVERLKKEIISTELFKCLEETHGESYKTFMLSKLIPVLGNVCESNLGIEPELADMMANEVDIIVNSAANTTFDERYDVALDINTRGPYRLMTFAKTCKKLQLFLQVSTAYVNGQRQGRVMEKPFCIGESIASESRISTAAAAGVLPMLDVEAEIKLAMESRDSFQDSLATQKMKDLGLERAKTYGWQDTYVFTKAMGEMMIDKMRGEIPVAIIRPSVIESTYNEPFPGWMEGNRMMDPIVLYYGKGQLTGFLVDPQGVLDVVPADMVVNAILAAMAKHGRKDVKAVATARAAAGINIYQIASSVVNPLVFQDLCKLLFEHFSSLPYMDSRGMPIQVPQMKLFSSMDDFSSHIWTEAVHRCEGLISSSKTTDSAISSTSDSNEDVISSSLHPKKKQLSKRSLEMVCKKYVEQAKYLANIYEPYTFYGGRFDNSNAQKLMEAMSDEEKRSFGFDVGSINWKDYISNVHIPGLRRHVMKGRGMFG